MFKHYTVPLFTLVEVSILKFGTARSVFVETTNISAKPNKYFSVYYLFSYVKTVFVPFHVF